jgi:hypothetical protein
MSGQLHIADCPTVEDGYPLLKGVVVGPRVKLESREGKNYSLLLQVELR